MGFKEASPKIRESFAAYGLDVGVLFRTNLSRVYGNKSLYGDTPLPGHIVMCLKNDHKLGIANGMRGVIESIKDSEQHHYALCVKFADDGNFARTYRANKHQFLREKTLSMMDLRAEYKTSTMGQLFDFGAALTVHKAQGSSFKDVYLSPKKFGGRDQDWARWLYTAVTRSSDRLILLPELKD